MSVLRTVAAWIAMLFCLFSIAGCAQVTLIPVPIGMPASVPTAPAAVEDEVISLLLDTPEAAIELYVEGIATGNLEQLLAATAVEQSARHFDFIAQTQRLRAIPPMHSLLPPDNDFLIGLNEARATQQILGQATYLIWGLLAGDEVDLDVGIMALTEPEDAVRIAALLDTTRLQAINLLAIEHPNAEVAQQENYLTLAERLAAVYGADEFTERIARLEFEGMVYSIGFSLLRYGEEWRVYMQNSGLSTLPMTGAPEPQ